MLNYLGLKDEAKCIETAIKKVLSNDKQMYSMYGELNTNKFESEIIKKINYNAWLVY